MTRQLEILAALRIRPWQTLRELGRHPGCTTALALVRRGYLTRRRRQSWHGAWEYAIATTAPLTRPRPTATDVLDSLQTLGGTASVRQLVEDTGRHPDLIRKALERAGAQRVGWDRGSRVWTLCSGADTL